jgi:hypothetical protein
VYAGMACEACLESSCGDAATACAASQPCADLEECLGPCEGGPECRALCWQQHRVGADTATPAFEACMVAKCSSPCGLVCGGVGEVAGPDAAVACQSCFFKESCSVVEGCLPVAACNAYFTCLMEARTPNESLACQPPDGGALFSGDGNGPASLNGLCVPDCKLASNWSCVGNVAWPSFGGSEFTIILHLYDVGKSMNVSGVTAKVCNLTDGPGPCMSPSATNVTGMDGIVSLTQHADAGMFTDNAYIDLSGGGIVPEVFFWSFPLTLSPAMFTLPVTTPTEEGTVARSVGVMQDPSKGAVVAYGFDCLQVNGEGMTFTLAPTDAGAFYQAGNTPSTVNTATDYSGGAFFANVPPNMFLTLTASVGASGPIGAGAQLFVRDGGLAEVWVLPSPN